MKYHYDKNKVVVCIGEHSHHSAEVGTIDVNSKKTDKLISAFQNGETLAVNSAGTDVSIVSPVK